MRRGWTSVFGGAALAAFMMVALPTSSWAGSVDDGNVLEKVQSARTASDQEAIATYFDGKAAEATKEAAAHRRMGESYKGLSGSATGKGYATSAMPQHCEAVAKSLDSEAEHYKAMAHAHRDLAKGAK